ncbi:MAG: DUF11 domain-containing protein, partial [Planctomycetes bacterium]|nr:DUF11 domain-containing protein [Planctomycetota bacterium]
MKTVMERLGFLAKASVLVGLMVSGQQALAQDTQAGTTITNQATVSFSVNGISQADVPSNAYEFEVDRRVDFVVSVEDPTLETINPNQTGLELRFLVTNEINDTLDFSLASRVLAAAEPFGASDEYSATGEAMAAVTIEVAPGIVGSGSEDPVFGANNGSIDNLGPGESIRVSIFADAPPTLPDAAIPALELSATALLSDGSALSDDTGVADDPGLVQNVFVNATDVLVEADGFSVASAAVSAVKSSEVISDPFGSANPKAIPGAVVAYTIVVTNNGSATATGISISDTVTDAQVQVDTATAVTRSVLGDCTINVTAGCTLGPGA